MSPLFSDRAVEWRGGALDQLIDMLAGPSLTARIEVFARDGAGETAIGEVHVIAGGVADSMAGALRGDEALALLRQARGRFRVEPRTPHPETGSLDPAGPEEGGLADRPLAALMRYCENYALTCVLEVWRGGEHAAIRYRRGEMSSTTVGGKDAPERLPEVLTWQTGDYQIVLPPLVLPAPPAAAPAAPVPATPAAASVAAAPVPETFATIRVPDPTAALRAPAVEAAPVAPTPAPTRRDPPRRATLMGISSPSPPRASPPRAPESDESEDDPRDTKPMIPAVKGHHTNRGMAVAVFDAQPPERTTDVGLPTMQDRPGIEHPQDRHGRDDRESARETAPTAPPPPAHHSALPTAVAHETTRPPAAPSPLTERGRAPLPATSGVAAPAPPQVPPAPALARQAPPYEPAPAAPAPPRPYLAPTIESAAPFPEDAADSPATIRATLTARGIPAVATPAHAPPAGPRPAPSQRETAPLPRFAPTPAEGVLPPLAAPRPPRAQPPRPAARRTALRREPVFERPVAFHVAIGLGVGLAVVAGYWALLALLG